MPTPYPEEFRRDATRSPERAISRSWKSPGGSAPPRPGWQAGCATQAPNVGGPRVIGATQEPRTVWTVRGSDLQCCLNQQRAPEGIRTPNLLIRSQMLYPLSYGRMPRRSDPRRRLSVAVGRRLPETVRRPRDAAAGGPG